MKTNNGNGNDMKADEIELSRLENIKQNLIKKTLLSNLLQYISKMLINTGDPIDGYLSGEEFKQLINYFHYLGGSSNNEPSLPSSIANCFCPEPFDQIKTYGESITSSSNPFLIGLNSLRDFLISKYPKVAIILSNIAPNDNISYAFGDSCMLSNGWLSHGGAEIIRELLQGGTEVEDNGRYVNFELREICQILPLDLLPNDPNCPSELSDREKQLSTALREINNLYYNISDFL